MEDPMFGSAIKGNGECMYVTVNNVWTPALKVAVSTDATHQGKPITNFKMHIAIKSE